MKYTRKFNSIEEANAAGAEGLFSPHADIVLDTDVYAVNLKKVNREKFTCEFDSEGHIVMPQEHSVGDIAYWDGSKLGYVPYTSWTASLGTAVAVCVIPTSHAAVWGNGKARFMSVKAMDESGSSIDYEWSMKWGGDTITASLTKYQYMPAWDNTIGGSTTNSVWGYISSDNFSASGTQNVIDTQSYYYATDVMLVSPYASDGSFYTDYARTIEGNNVLSDFNGKGNTATLVGQGTSFVAANACNSYSASGVSAGNWYLPGGGELAYLAPRVKLINSALTTCEGVKLTCSNQLNYWSSTYYGLDGNHWYSYYVNLGWGQVYRIVEYNYCAARPFCQL